MHAYDVPRSRNYQPIPSSRTDRDSPGGPSATPIYDRLYSEWVKTFRSLPGDRSGEEELGFTAFGHSPHSTGTFGGGSLGGGSYSAYSAGAYSARQQSQWQRVGQLGQVAQQHQHGHTGMHHIPAALPPGPRRGI
ncbi:MULTISPECIES: hypothetical protein [unclassified Streptomyces]|uniref:hypothetical protein n=1 Tax=unclassified Streptomyces TaxID=2593676 RepID=UPI00225AD8D1|nr:MULTISPECIES: hypothetical protein [unclassified Streptomyces]MCX4810007.1 hypothetical protein [Streptomyces sp. NBC_01239]